MKKKIVTLVFAVVMIMTLSLFASAADRTGEIKVFDSFGEIVSTYEIVTNNTSVDARDAIQKALRYCRDNASENDIHTVKLPKGEYCLFQTLNLYSNTVFDLSGSVITRTEDCDSMVRFGTASAVVYGYDGYENISIINGTFDAENNGNTSLVRFAHASDVEISDITFTNTTNVHHLFTFAASKNVKVKNCVFSNMKITEDLEGFNCEAVQIDILKKGYFSYPAYDGTTTKNVTITGCTFENVPRGLGTHSGIAGHYFDGIVIKNNTFKDIESYAIRTINYINTEICDNTITNCGSGISFGTVTNEVLSNFFAPASGTKFVEDSNTVISNNKISLRSKGADTSAFGIRLLGMNINKFKDKSGKVFSGDLRVSGVTVENNTITSAVSQKNFNAIHLDGAKGSEYGKKSNVIVKNNKITFNYKSSTENTIYGIKAEKSENIYFYGNSVTDKKSNIHSCAVFDECGGIYLEKNKLNGARSFGIKFTDVIEGTAVSNTVSGVKSNGIYVFTGSKNIVVTANKIKNPSDYGIAVSDGHASSISSNKIYNTGKYSIYITQKGKAKTISSNYVCGGKDTGIYLNKSASATTVTKNTVDVVSDKCDAICVNDKAKVVDITDNKINMKEKKESSDLAVKCKYGIRVSGDAGSVSNISGNSVYGCTKYSIYVSDKAKAGTISSNYVCGGKDTGIYLNSSASSTTITKNTIDVVSDKVDGICVNDKAKVTNITKNKINAKTEKASADLKVKCKYGIRVSGDAGNVKKISGNSVYGCTKYSIYVSDKAKAGTISSNYVCGGKDTGIYLNSSASSTTITKNTIDVVSDKVDGICVNDKARVTNITNNKINTKTEKASAKLKVKCKYGIRISSTACAAETISENIVYSCSKYSIYLSSKSKAETISSNYICGGKDTGIYLNQNASATNITGNIVDIVSAEGDGICVNDKASAVNITDNKINTKNEKASSKLKVKCRNGIRINSPACKAKTIKGNEVNSCEKDGIYIPSVKTKVTVSGNTVKKARNGIAYKKGKAKLSKNTVSNCSGAKTKAI